jgi:hypothetical protein
MLFYSEYFSTTMNGLVALEANGESIMRPWRRVLLLCRDIANRMLIPLEKQSLAVRLGIGTVKTTYRVAKFTFKRSTFENREEKNISSCKLIYLSYYSTLW